MLKVTLPLDTRSKKGKYDILLFFNLLVRLGLVYELYSLSVQSGQLALLVLASPQAL
jgi:hypothetical protein